MPLYNVFLDFLPISVMDPDTSLATDSDLKLATQHATKAYMDSSLSGMSSNAYQATPSDPTGTTNGTGLMMGLTGSVTPTRSGKVQVIISGNIANNTAGAGAQTQIRYGTSTAPTNGAALTGTAVGGLSKVVNALIALLVPGSGNFTCNAIVSGLTLNTAYWIDLSLARITGGTANLTNISISVNEL